MKNLYAEFRRVAEERLDRLEGLLSAAEHDDADAEVHRALRREIHTLKGEANMLGLPRARRLAEIVEVLIHRLGASESDGDAVRLALEGLDHLDDVIRGLDDLGVEGRADDEGFEERVGGEARALAVDPAGPSEQRDEHSEPPREDAGRSEPLDAAESDVRVSGARLAELLRLVASLELLHRKRQEAATAISRLAARVADVRWKVAAAAAAAGPTRPAGAASLTAATLACEELDRELRESLSSIKDSALDEARSIDALGLAMRSLSTVRVSDALARFRRPFRRIAREAGKAVVLRVDSEHINVERRVMEALSEPIMHLLTNAVDHGIEPSEVRAARGKPQTATVTLRARLAGARVRISVSDDGAGIAIDAIRQRAIDAGLLHDRGDAPSADQALRILTGAGFTTRTEVTALSGRGVGLDVVNERIKTLGGRLSLRTAEGDGSSFEIEAPTTATVARVVMVEAGGGIFALPVDAVEAIVDPAGLTVQRIGRGEMVRFAGAPTLLRSLAEVLHLPGSEKDEETRIVFVADAGARRAFFVDAVRGTVAVVVHSPGKLLEADRMVRSLVATPEGRIAPVLDPAVLLTEASRAPSEPLEPPVGPATILVVDDSEIARQLVARHLARAGFAVVEAMDGRAAMIELSRRPPDAIVTDLEMPVMDGFQLIRAVRSAPTFSHLPVVVLSSLSAEAARARAGSLGADAYIVKETLDELTLRETLERLIGASPRPARSPRGVA